MVQKLQKTPEGKLLAYFQGTDRYATGVWLDQKDGWTPPVRALAIGGRANMA
jgi:hypothetical protein